MGYWDVFWVRKRRKSSWLNFYKMRIVRRMDHEALFGVSPFGKDKIDHIRIVWRRRGPGLTRHLQNVKKSWGYRR